MKTFGQIVRRKRERWGLTRRDVEKDLGIRTELLSRIEAGTTTEATGGIVYALACYLRLSPTKLLRRLAREEGWVKR